MKKEQIKVLLVAPIPPPVGGDSTWTFKYLEYCNQHNLPVRHINTSIIGERAKTVDDSVNIFDEIKRCYRIWRNITVAVREYHPDIVHMNTNCSPRGLLRDYIAGLIVRYRKIPLIIHCRCNVADQISNSKIGKFLFRKLAHLSNRIITQNRKSLLYVEKLTRGNTLIVPNYMEKNNVINSKVISQQIEQVIYVGHIRNSKGIRELLEVARNVPGIRFILVGPITNDFTTDSIIHESKGNVVVKGSLLANEVKELLDKSDVFIFPTYTEGFSNALLEAMSRGLPVITTDVGANHDMIEESGGIIIETKSVKALEEALKNMAEPRVRSEMSRWNINKVKNNYIIEQVMELMRNLYLEVCTNSDYQRIV